MAAGAALVLLGLVTFFWLPRVKSALAVPALTPVAVSYGAPSISLTDLEGAPASLEDYRGQVALVNLWATWCEPCKREMPALRQFHNDYMHEGFTVIAINIGEPQASVATFAQNMQLSFPIWLDPGSTYTLSSFRAAGLPSSYVIDRSGDVRLSWVGAIDLRGLEEYVTPIIRE